MKLQLYINGDLFNELALPAEEFKNNMDLHFQDRAEVHKERMDVYVEYFKSMFFQKLGNAKHFEIWLVAESNTNELTVDIL